MARKEKKEKPKKIKISIHWPTHVACENCKGDGCKKCKWKGKFER